MGLGLPHSPRVEVDILAAAAAIARDDSEQELRRAHARIRNWVRLGYLQPVEPTRRGVRSRFWLHAVYACERARRAADRTGAYR